MPGYVRAHRLSSQKHCRSYWELRTWLTFLFLPQISHRMSFNKMQLNGTVCKMVLLLPLLRHLPFQFKTSLNTLQTSVLSLQGFFHFNYSCTRFSFRFFRVTMRKASPLCSSGSRTRENKSSFWDIASCVIGRQGKQQAIFSVWKD